MAEKDMMGMVETVEGRSEGDADPGMNPGFTPKPENDGAGHAQQEELLKVMQSPPTEAGGSGNGMPSSIGVERYKHVEGHDGRLNDIIYCPPLSSSGLENGFLEDAANFPGSNSSASGQMETKVAVYFGGDIQDYPEIMITHRDHRHYTKWSLEATAALLREQFPHHHIVVIRPSRMQMLTFSCFDNFVPCSNTGVPEHTPNHNSLQHLEVLLRVVSERIAAGPSPATGVVQENGTDAAVAGASIANSLTTTTTDKPDSPTTSSGKVQDDSFVSSTTTEDPTTTSLGNGGKGQVDDSTEQSGSSLSTTLTSTSSKEGDAKTNPGLDKAKLTLIGFSKGCVVLNQFLYEFHYLKTLTPDDESMEGFLSRLEHMYWLDGGHSGGKNTWITSRSLLETLKRLGVRIHVHMTPYQLSDDRRPWIRKEEKTFSESLERFGARIHRHVHFEAENPSLELHLQLLSEFKMDEDDTDDDVEEEDEFDDDCLDMC